MKEQIEEIQTIDCRYCGKPCKLKGIQVHEARCKNNPKNIVVPTQESQSSGQDPHNPQNIGTPYQNKQMTAPNDNQQKGRLKKVWDSVFHGGKNARQPIKKPPIIIKPPSPEFTDAGLNDAERLKKFLADAPLWTQYKPTGLRKFLSEKLNPDKTFAPCVFVGENRPPRVLYLPYEPERNRLIIPKKGYYRTPTTGLPFFFHEDFMLPLVNSPNLKDTFQLPGHVVESAYSGGLMEGKLQAAGQLIEEIKKYKTLLYVFGFITILCLLVVIMVAYSYDSNYKHLAGLYTNLSQRLPQGNGIRVP